MDTPPMKVSMPEKARKAPGPKGRDMLNVVGGRGTLMEEE